MSKVESPGTMDCDPEICTIQIREMLSSSSKRDREDQKKCYSSKMLPCGRFLSKSQLSSKELKACLKIMSERLNSYILDRNLRRSNARKKILETIVYEARHFRAQDLIDTVKRRYPKIGQATIYRTIPVLIESGIIREGPINSDGHILYEIVEYKHHDHIVCLDCRNIFEFQDEFIENRQSNILKSSRFSPKSHRHVIFASCEYMHEKK